MCETKVCKYCEEEKSITDFRAGKVKGKVYVRHKCKKCELKVKDEWSKKNPKKCAKHKKDHYNKNKEKYNKMSKEWVKANPEKRRKIALDYARRNPEKLSKYRKENSEKIKKDNRRRVINLQDSYVINNIIAGTSLTQEDIKAHPEIIEATKEIYKIKRLIKSIQDGKCKPDEKRT